MIEIYGIEINVQTDGYPCWVRIRIADQEISFSHNKIQIVIDALEHCKKDMKNALPDGRKEEVVLSK